MSKIKVNPGALKENANALLKQINNIEQEQEKLIRLIAEISESWEGAASEALVNKIRKEIDSSKKVIKILQEYHTYIKTAIDKFENSDKKAANKIRNSF